MKVAVLGSGAGALSHGVPFLSCRPTRKPRARRPHSQPTNARSCPAPATSPPDPTWPPRPAGSGSPRAPARTQAPDRSEPISIDLQSTGPRATLCGMANDCPVLMVLLWCQSVNDDVRLHGGAPAAQGRESCLGWDNP